MGSVWGLIWDIIAGAIVAWLTDLVSHKIPPLWERYWPHIYQNILCPVLERISDTTAQLLKNPPTLVEEETTETPVDQNTLVQASDTISHPITNKSNCLTSDHEDSSATSVSEPHIPLEGGTMERTLDQNILGPASDPILHPITNLAHGLQSDHENITAASVSEPNTPLEGGAMESPLDQNVLGQTSDPILNPTCNISSSHEDINGKSFSESATLTEGGTPTSVDASVDFFREYDEGSRYRIEEVIGKGNHGVICSAYDTYLGEKVAIKRMNDIFKKVSDATRVLREIKLLRLLRHADIVEIKHILLPPSRSEFKDIYVVFEHMEGDLRTVVQAKDDLTPEHCQFFLYQLLRGLKYIHTANVFHRDLNPRNILAIAQCKLKIRHFSHAFVDTPTAIFWTDYVATRWYKAPELCGQFFSKYSPAIDIWSIGCIFAELLTGKPLFPGENSAHQLDLITDLLGTPSPEFIAKIRNEKARTSLSSMQKKRPIPFSQKFPNADRLALRLLERMLAFDPDDRPSAQEALADLYFKDLARIEREPCAEPITEAELEFERLNVTKEDVRELIYEEILENYPQMLKKEHNHPQMLKKEQLYSEEPEPTNSSYSFSRRRSLLAKVTSMTPKKLLHHHSS